MFSQSSRMLPQFGRYLLQPRVHFANYKHITTKFRSVKHSYVFWGVSGGAAVVVAVASSFKSSSFNVQAASSASKPSILLNRELVSDDNEGVVVKWSQLWNLILPDLHWLFLAVAGAVGAAILNVCIPVALRDLVNLVVSGSATVRQLVSYSAKLMSLYISQGAVTFLYISVLGLMGENLAIRLRCQLFHSLLMHDMTFFDKTRSADLVNRLTSDVQDFKSSFKQCVSNGLRHVVQLSGSVVYMLFVSPKLSGAVLFLVPTYVVIGYSISYFLRALSRTAASQQSKSTIVAQEALSNIRTVRSFSMEDFESNLYQNQVHQSGNLYKHLAIGIGMFQALSNIAINSLVLTVISVGGYYYTRQEINQGELTSYLVTIQVALKSLGSVSQLFGQALRGFASAGRVLQYMDSSGSKIECCKKGHTSFTSSRVDVFVKFDNVYFAYPGRPDASVICGINLTIPENKIVAICGQSGSGKTTLTYLLERFYDPQNGSISLAGCDLRSYNIGWLRKHMIGYISQEPTLFQASIRENIRYGRPEASDSEVEDAAMKANAHEFISNFPNGYNTNVGERGLAMSGGQKQRIAIARALLKDPKLLILDEATSALDSESEQLVQKALDVAMKDRTVIVIAHRLSTIRNADVIVVMNKGRIVETGSRNELLKKKGHYWNMLNIQQDESTVDYKF